jgi:hypothetical protein
VAACKGKYRARKNENRDFCQGYYSKEEIEKQTTGLPYSGHRAILFSNASFMTSTGGLTPVHISKAITPCHRSMPRPCIVLQPFSAAARKKGVSL